MASQVEDPDLTVKPMGYGVGRGYRGGNWRRISYVVGLIKASR